MATHLILQFLLRIKEAGPCSCRQMSNLCQGRVHHQRLACHYVVDLRLGVLTSEAIDLLFLGSGYIEQCRNLLCLLF
jgi:hypothetical protein